MQQPQLLKLHERITEHARDLMRRKNNDYSGEASVFGNLDACDVVTGGKCSTETGILIRMQDKISRGLNIEVKRIGGDTRDGVADERFTDICEDLINYAILLGAKHIDRLAHGDEARIDELIDGLFPATP